MKLSRRRSACLPLVLVASLSGTVGQIACSGETPGKDASSGLAGTASSRQLSQTPSILLISLDTTRADHLGCYGYRAASTPHIDRWADEGVVFEQALSPVPITLPAHASILTGLFAHRHGVRDNGIYGLPEGPETLPGRLAEAGYDTAAVVAAAVLDRQYGLDRGFGVYDDTVSGGRFEIAERKAGEVTDRALSVARGLTRPFFLFVHYFDPHSSYDPPAPFSSRYRSSPYDGEIAYVDQELGRLRRELTSLGLLDDTIVVITSDHGEGLGEHGEPTHGVFLYQSTLHVPLVMVVPGLWPAGTRVQHLVSLVDIVPTLLELTGSPALADLDGSSLAGLVDGGSRGERWLPLESEYGFNAYGWATLAGITDGKQKWIGAPEPELYDLARDPGERRNLAVAQPDERDRLVSLWRAQVAEDRRASLDQDLPGLAGPERLARLSALGYVTTPAGASRDDDALPDPKRGIRSLEVINGALGLMGARRFAEAERMLAKVIDGSPRNLSAQALLGSCRLMTGRPAEALDPLRRATEIAPANADAHFNLGLAWVSLGRMDEAERAWRRCLDLNPRRHDAAANLIDLMLRGRRLGDARAVLAEARRHQLRDPMLDFLEGKIALLRGDEEGARAALSRALKGSLPEATAAAARAMLRRLDSGAGAPRHPPSP
jgi:arylsulfatase A-like enzyme/Tfp pilus assembly protein PilF